MRPRTRPRMRSNEISGASRRHSTAVISIRAGQTSLPPPWFYAVSSRQLFFLAYLQKMHNCKMAKDRKVYRHHHQPRIVGIISEDY